MVGQATHVFKKISPTSWTSVYQTWCMDDIYDMNLYFSSECLRVWLNRNHTRRNFKKSSLWFHFFPKACDITCDLRLPFWLNLLPHVLHSNGFSPVWIRTCCSSFHLEGNIFPHKVQGWAKESDFSENKTNMDW